MNWSNLIKQLQAHGMTQVEIAKACKVRQPTISDLLTGKTTEPLGGTALKLIALRESIRSTVLGAEQ